MIGSLLVVIGLILWILPFVRAKWNFGGLETVDKRARWGMALEGVGMALILGSRFWTAVWPSWRVGIAIIGFALAAAFSWTATQALGSHLRFDAAIGREHELVQSGPYALVRHPIYTSLLCLLVGVGSLAAPWWLFLAALSALIVGTEIRVRVEDRLLEARFGEQFHEFRKTTRAYLPLIR